MHSEFSEINVTPFTDVLLVLLVVFMILAALITPPGFERRLPSRDFRPAQVEAHRQVTVTVSKSGLIRMNDRAVSAPQLYGAFARVAGRNRHTGVALYADAASPYAVLIRVLDAAKEAGLSDVTLVTQ